MARKPTDYWEKRQTELMKQLEKETTYTINDLVNVYNNAATDLNKRIKKMIENYSINGQISKETANLLLNKKESELYYNNLLTTINSIEDLDIKKKLLAKYNAPAYAFRISRLESIRDEIYVNIKRLAAIEKNITEQRYIEIINKTYYKNIYNVQKQTGIGFDFNIIDSNMIELMLNENWFNKANFSKRIWNNTDNLAEYINHKVVADISSGKTIQKISKDLSEAMNVGLYNATTLVRTEVNHFTNEAEMLSYEECGAEKYRFVATLDIVTCDHCAELDNKIFLIKDRNPGKNYPPIHPNDRCTTVIVLEDEQIEDLKRTARNPITGKNYKVPQNMNYKEWMKEHNIVNYETYL